MNHKASQVAANERARHPAPQRQLPRELHAAPAPGQTRRDLRLVSQTSTRAECRNGAFRFEVSGAETSVARPGRACSASHSRRYAERLRSRSIQQLSHRPPHRPTSKKVFRPLREAPCGAPLFAPRHSRRCTRLPCSRCTLESQDWRKRGASAALPTRRLTCALLVCSGPDPQESGLLCAVEQLKRRAATEMALFAALLLASALIGTEAAISVPGVVPKVTKTTLLISVHEENPPAQPVAARQVYGKNGDVAIEANKLMSTKTQTPYDYYTLPYCQSDVQERSENLGQRLAGDKLESSGKIWRVSFGALLGFLLLASPSSFLSHNRHLKLRSLLTRCVPSLP
eukprot:scaffold358_cov256-Pinguiococcus_pyrenoidosus.AAC.26